jgi:signal transduction histidine kinase
MVRYDSMLATALSYDGDDASARTAQWRQLVDLVVQAAGDLSPAVRAAALKRIGDLRDAVPAEQRRLAAIQVASRAVDADAVSLFGLDEPAVAAPVLSVVQLDSENWQQLIAQLPAASRALLRNRRDLPEAATRGLASYGLSDFALPSNGNVTDASAQIRDLVARIEAFRLGSAGAAPGLAAETRIIEDFAFETNPDGLFDWISGAPREPLIGLSVAEIADIGGYGVDGQAAGAFRRRAPFRDARLLVAGAGSASGDWLITGSPVFNPRDGRFAGYHGTARRPRPDEVAGPSARFAGTSLPVDSLRQLIHELRTPLNAILGFAEMIDRQLLGPAARAYREQAQAIVQDGQRLLDLVDDLDQAARARSNAGAAEAVSDGAAMLARIGARLNPMLEARGAALAINADHALDVGGVSPAVLERMMTRLIGAALSLATAGETITVRFSETSFGQPLFSVARPAALDGVSDLMLLDPSYDPETPYPDAPLLGLGFTLRLIAGLARDIGGKLTITAEAFVVTLSGRQANADLPAGIP